MHGENSRCFGLVEMDNCNSEMGFAEVVPRYGKEVILYVLGLLGCWVGHASRKKPRSCRVIIRCDRRKCIFNPFLTYLYCICYK